MSKMNIFSRLEKFHGNDGGPDLCSWLKTFERCRTIAEKKQPGTGPTTLMGGSALAILEQLEEEKGSQLKYTDLKKALTTVFDSDPDREAHMTGFETTVQGLGKTKDEYMLALIKLFKAVNPDANIEDINRAVKRKFLNGISNDLHRNLSIFLNNPLEEKVSHSDLLQVSHKAHVHFISSGTTRDGLYAGSTPSPDDPIFVNGPSSKSASRPTPPKTSEATVAAITPASTADENTLAAVLSLTKKLEEQVQLTEQQFKEYDDKINCMQQGSNPLQLSRPHGRRQNRGFACGQMQDSFSSQQEALRAAIWAASPQQEAQQPLTWHTPANNGAAIRCHYCNKLNHLKQDCLLFKRHAQQ